ncbi:MAG: phosphatase [Armatimonadetes bacterium CG07_land_8_20_14_0_80_40_9]|nr:MAG: phosphatase [Armatimonadetes bacterium CG07_land_8_20_14_0_80_40_9]
MELCDNMYGDLHLHTSFSDGVFSPEEVVKKAQEAGLEVISICDHDSIEGILPAIRAGKVLGIKIVPGVEISADLDKSDLHILGYFFNLKDLNLRQKLKELHQARLSRAEKIIKKLNQLGVKISLKGVLQIAGEGSLGRPHIAKAIVQAGYTNDEKEAFKKYINRDKPAYVPHDKITPFAAISLLLGAGGIPVLAHPNLNLKDEIIPELVRAGLKGIEVYCPAHNQEQTLHYKRIAKRFNLLVSGGSDFHGPGSAVSHHLAKLEVPSWVKERIQGREQ